MMRLLPVLLVLLGIGSALAQPTTTTAPTSLLNTQCSSSQFLRGTGTSNPPACQAITLGLLPSIAANTVLGATAIGAPTALALPSCSGAANAITWTSASGWGCNTISVGSAAGTVNLLTFAGIVTGAGQTLGTRQSNCTNINAAISFAQSNNLELDAPTGIYEISCAGGIVVPAVSITGVGFKWRGTRTGTLFVQYYATSPGAPILTIGDPTGATLSYGIDFDGASLSYGVSQTGLTSSVGLILGAMSQSRISGISAGVCCTVTNPAYDGMQITDNSNLNFIGNSISDIVVSGAQRHLLNANNSLGAGNVFSNIVLRDGTSGSLGVISGQCLVIGVAALGNTYNTEPKFTGLTCEYISTNLLMQIVNANGMKIDDLHLEGIKSTGANPSLIDTEGVNLKIGSLQILNWTLQTANITGSAKIITDGSFLNRSSNLAIQSLNLLNTIMGSINTPFTVLVPTTASGDNGVFNINQMTFIDTDTPPSLYAGNMSIDPHMPTSSSAFLTPGRAGDYNWGLFGSRIDKEVIPVSATYTHYGQQTGASLEIPAAITSFTITLQAVQGATGTAPVQVGTVTCALRATGSVSGTLTVQDDASTSLTAPNSTGAKNCYIFNGTHYVNLTPVT